MKKIYFLVLTLCFFNFLSAQIINFPDPLLKEHLLFSTYGGVSYDVNHKQVKIDANNDGEIEVNEISNVTELYFAEGRFTSIEGISNFKNLEVLTIKESKLTSLDLSGMSKLRNVDIQKNNNLVSVNLNNLASLEVATLSDNLNFDSFKYQDLPNVKRFYCSYNKKITSLDLTKLPKAEIIAVYDNKLESFKVSNLKNLVELYFSGNQIKEISLEGLVSLDLLDGGSNLLSSLNLDGASNLSHLVCLNNKIEYLNLDKLTKLNYLNCRFNQLLTLDLSNTAVTMLICNDNSLTSLYLKNDSFKYINMSPVSSNFDNNPSLKYLCIPEGIEAYNRCIKSILPGCKNIGDINKIVVNSHCSFIFGGTDYEIKGTTKLDIDKNGCDELDYGYPNLKLKLNSNNIGSEYFIANASGNYLIPAAKENYTLIPEIENKNYFSVLPESVSIDFLNQTNSLSQDFCVTPVGVHSDLEVSLLPITAARPGFDSKYKIVYKNKGNNTQSGKINLAFNDAVLDLVLTNPETSIQTINNLSWNFSNLRPFETREIIFTLNINSPMETPAVNGGFVLVYNATISSGATDETPIDNSFNLNQTVVNSFDPNDKTCLEGEVITPSLIGEYVHYMIRFENTGTYPAQNIVVKDMIDLSKFDISTLIPTSSSHSFVTKISDGNKVEFIFEGINLPFADANNDGYISFKIKTKPTLKVGDSFTNDANIYFDYNFPILTNKATSTFKTLGIQDFEFSNYFTLYPNPVNQVLNINATKDIEIESLAIYDILGQLVIAVPNAKSVSNIDVSKLRTGNYFIKVKSDLGSTSMKFIKK